MIDGVIIWIDAPYWSAVGDVAWPPPTAGPCSFVRVGGNLSEPGGRGMSDVQGVVVGTGDLDRLREGAPWSDRCDSI